MLKTLRERSAKRKKLLAQTVSFNGVKQKKIEMRPGLTYSIDLIIIEIIFF